MNHVEEYVNASKFQYRDALDAIEEYGKEISEMRGRCLDIGCGPANVTKTLLLPKLDPEVEVVGADISKPMIEYAKKHYSDNKRLSFICLNAETPELPDDLIEHFNHVVSFFCLHWCVNPWQTFNNIWKVLKPGGTAITMFLARNDGFDVYMDLYEKPEYRPYMEDIDSFVPYYHKCTDQRSTLRKILEQTGFEVLHCSKREKSYVHPNEQGLTTHMLAVNPFVDKIPEDLKEKFKEDVAQGLINRKILFRRQNECVKTGYKVLDIYDILVAHIKKPLTAVRKH